MAKKKSVTVKRTKRVTVATLSGVLFGFVCYGLASMGDGGLAWPVVVQIIASRALIGFVIGISNVFMPLCGPCAAYCGFSCTNNMRLSVLFV